MPRNFSRIVLLLGAALLAAAPALHAQQTGAPVRGDVDGDGRVTAADARIVNDYLVGKPVPAGANVRERGDVNGDGRVTAVDAAIIAAAAAGRDVSRFPVGKAAPDAVAVLECTGDVRTSSVECHAPGASAGGARGDIIVGGQNVNVKLTSANNAKVAPDTFQFTVTVQNLLHQAMAADSGTGAANATGVRVFFASGPSVTGGGGSISVANANGMGTYTGTNQKYFQYSGADLGGDGILSPNETSQPRTWKLQYTGSPQFSFLLFLSTPMQYPKGWVDIYPPNNHYSSPDSVFTDTMQVGTTLQLQDSVRNPFGGVIPGASVTWTNTGHGHATVNGTGLVSALSAGVDSVIATDGPRSGRVKIVVAGLSVDSTTITANPTTIAAGDTSLITVQVKDEFGHNVTTGGATVVLSTNLGTLKSTAGTGSSVTANDNGNGTYTAKLTHTATGTATVTGTLNGTPIVDNATVTIGAATPANMAVHSANPQTGTAGQPAGSPPGVLVTDTYGNPVAGVSILFTVTSGGGTVSNGGPAASSTSVSTGANGIATVTSWTLGTTAGTNTNTVQATATGLTAVNFTASTDPGPAANIAKNAGDGQSAVVNTNVATAPQVKITDTYGNVVPGVSVTFAPASGGGSVTGGSTSTDAGGLATVGSWKLGTTVGANTLTATAGALSTTFNATATADVPANITKTSTDPQSGTVGVAVGSAPAVHVTDQYGNATPGITVTFAVTGGGGSTTGASPTTDASGNATIGSWTPGSTAPGPNTLSATASGGSNPSATFTVYVPPVAVNDSSQAMGNTSLGSSVAPNVLSNDAGLNGAALSFSTPTETPQPTVRSGSITLHANGTFDYTPPAGNVLRDSMQYTVTDGQASASAYIKIRFVGKVWYVDNTNGGAADGRNNTPFTSVSAAAAAAGVNDSILVRTGSGTTGGGTLKNGQLVYGAGASSAFTTTLNGSSVTLLPAASPPSIGALTLGSGNTLRGFTGVGTLTGSGFGTLTVSEVGLSTGANQALSLTTGTLSGGFTSLVSSGGTNNVLLSGVASTGSTMGASGNALSGASGDGVVITGGGGSFTFPGNVSNSNASTFAVNVNGKTGGTVTFSGNINPSVAGQGISVSGNSTGSNTIVFSGGTKAISSNTAAGVTLTSNTGATIQFTGGGLAIATTTGTPFTATGGGTVEVTGAGNTISATGNAVNVVNLNGITLGANGMTFASIASSGTPTGSAFSATSVGNTSGSTFSTPSLSVSGTTGASSRGLAISSSSAPFTFTTVSINGTGGEGIYLNGNTGAVNVNGGTVGNTTSTTGDALAVSGGSAGIAVAASLTKSTAGRIANIANHTAGSVTVSGALSCTSSCMGIIASGNSGGTIDFSNGTKTLTTGANAAVALSSNTGATVNFSGGGLALTTTTGTAFDATGGGTVNVTGSNNTVSTSGGVGVNIQNTTIGSSHVTFKSVNKSTGSSYGIRLENTGTSGGFKVTGDGSTANSGGTITQSAVTATDSAAVTLTSTGDLSLEFMKLSITTGSGASGISGVNLTGTNLVRKTTVDYNNVAPAATPTFNAYAARFVQTTASPTITLDAVTFQNKLDGATAGSLSAGGTATVNFNVIDSNTGDSFGSTFQGLKGSGWVISSGDTGGSTGTVNLTVSDSKFLNAAANGTNNLELTGNASSTLNYKIKNNQFSAVANASFTAGIINLQTFDTAVLGGTTAMDSVVGNTVTNSGISSAVTDLGYIGIRVAVQSASATTHRVVIANNSFTDLWRQGILLSTRQNATGHIKVVNNVVGTAALPVGQSGRRGLETDLQDNSVMNLEATGNSFVATSSTDTRAAFGIRVGTNSGSATLNATVLSNSMSSTAAGTNGRFSAESSSTGTGTMCLDVRTNTLDGATKLFTLAQTGGTFKVEGAGTGAVTSANITSANTVGTGNVSGTINFNNSANCTQPPI